ncbi:SapC family protein [Sphingosinicella sp. BN140058]|uniref:SapC family protein n=1 Tax=Sphingosinicella sp. BN140058 TaxID=1892855 RepID=UPI0010114710|nr:SapC family protein [Sphingosinicella sp. BN140058]QAY76448.1 multidrug transporter [Sphingosinicella sp. BN140058]
MPDWQYLNHERHAALRIDRGCDSKRHFAQVVAAEFPEASIHYPIVFTKNPESGAFYAGVIMGLEPGTNLLATGGKLPDYRPADLERQGFFLEDDNVVIDLESAAFASGEGEVLFEHGGEAAPALKRVQHALKLLRTGIAETEEMIERLVTAQLLEPIDVTLNFDDGKPIRLEGLYTISLDGLHGLPDALVLELFRAGDLQLAYSQTNSIRHVRTLARIRNERLPGAA